MADIDNVISTAISTVRVRGIANRALIDSNFIRGGLRTSVTAISDLYTIEDGQVSADVPGVGNFISDYGQVKDHATIVYVTDESEFYVLVDKTNIGVAAGWATLGSLVKAPSVKLYNKTSTAHHEAQGDIVTFGTGSLTAGLLYFYKYDGSWNDADADMVITSGSVLLGLALGDGPEDGMLLRGMFTLHYNPVGATVGSPCYVSAGAGFITATAPGSGDVVRVVGYCLDGTNGQIWFNPDNTWVELA
jgi:hypothetical protein